jgi:hypothetical protein
MDLAFGLTVAPRQRQSGSYGWQVGMQATGESLQIYRTGTRGGLSHPRIKIIGVPISHHFDERHR